MARGGAARDAWHVTTHTAADSTKALRMMMKLTQQQLADASEVLSREEIAKLEGGKLKARSARTRAGLARAFRLPLETMTKLLDGEIGAEDAFGEVGSGNGPMLPDASSVGPHRFMVELVQRFASLAVFLQDARDDGADERVLTLLCAKAALQRFANGDPGYAYWPKMYEELAGERAGERKAFRGSLRVVGDELEDDAPAVSPRLPAPRR